VTAEAANSVRSPVVIVLKTEAAEACVEEEVVTMGIKTHITPTVINSLMAMLRHYKLHPHSLYLDLPLHFTQSNRTPTSLLNHHTLGTIGAMAPVRSP